MNKLQLVDAVKLNEMFEYLKNDHENKKLLQGIKKQDEFQLEEKKEAMENAVRQNKHPGESVVSFLKQKNALKRKADNLTVTGGDGDETKKENTDKKEGEEESQEKKTPSERKIIEFLNKKGLKSNTLQMGNKSINRADLIYDLSHNATKQFMLNINERRVALKYLKKKKNMPASIIKNTVLRNHYTSKQSESDGATGGESEGSSSTGTSSTGSSSITDLFFDVPVKKQKGSSIFDTNPKLKFAQQRAKARGRLSD